MAVRRRGTGSAPHLHEGTLHEGVGGHDAPDVSREVPVQGGQVGCALRTLGEGRGEQEGAETLRRRPSIEDRAERSSGGRPRRSGRGEDLPRAPGLAFAAGAMLFVISDEIIPESHRNGHERLATFGVMIGFAVMMLLDVLLG